MGDAPAITFLLVIILIFSFVLNGREAIAMPIALMGLETNECVLWEQMATIGLLMMAPVFAFTYLIQKNLVKGLTSGAVK